MCLEFKGKEYCQQRLKKFGNKAFKQIFQEDLMHVNIGVESGSDGVLYVIVCYSNGHVSCQYSSIITYSYWWFLSTLETILPDITEVPFPPFGIT